ncbi:MAG: helix-turn-helix domain-containing protein [Clostridia bacterium]|nr:helix-turn-helix domain-containing protein [Clostridia bacterium]
MNDLNYVIAKNITTLRKANNYTQAELAEKLNYSDKSISKWENGESVPSIEVLVSIANLFGVGVDYFVKENTHVPKVLKKPQKNKMVITLLSLSLVWLVALAVFTLFMVAFKINLWTIFIWAVPACFVVTTVFACLWSPRRRFKYISISLLIWTMVTAIYIQFFTDNLWMLYIVAIPLQIAVVLWAFLTERPAKILPAKTNIQQEKSSKNEEINKIENDK